MWLPSGYGMAFLMLLCSMFCWGSWANALKMMGKCRFELFYWDFVAGTTLVSLVLAFTLGSRGASGLPFLADFNRAPWTNLLFAFAGGVVWNSANILLTAAIAIAGLAVAFPLGVGIAIVIGSILNYIVAAKNDPILLFGGVVLLVGAITLDALAYRVYSGQGAKKTTRAGLVLCVIAGIGVGLFYPLVAKSISGPDHPGPYTVGVVFMWGVLLSTIVLVPLVMAHPITGQPPLPASAYFRMPARWHALGLLLGGALWGTGTVFNFAVSSAGVVGPAACFALGNGATMVSAIWGLVAWKEFQGAAPKVRRMLVFMFILFVLGLSSIAISPLVSLL